MDDDIRLITRAGQRRLADEDLADIFGEGRSMVEYFIDSVCLYLILDFE